MKEKAPAGTFRHLRWATEENIGYLVIDHPPNNEINETFLEELGRIIPVIRTEAGLRGIILTGAGRHFSSGANLDELLGAQRRITFEEMYRNYQSVTFFEELNIPVVAAIRGVCIGAAFEIALLCHFRVCSEDAVLGLPESTFNLMPGLGGIRNMIRLAGKAKTLELILRGSTFGARDAFSFGLADLVVPKKDLTVTAASLIHFASTGYDRGKKPLYLHRYIDKYVALHSQTL